MTRTTLASLFLATSLLAACGGGDDGTDPGTDGGGDPDLCGFGSDRYLPFEVGYTWTYQITDLATGERATKEQTVDEMIDDATFGSVLVQTTGKLNGTTRSLFSVDGDRLLRRQQEDFDAVGTLERTTVYDPGQLRIDETPARLEAGATFEESYDETETPAGGVAVTVPTTDAWEVLEVGVACTVPAGTFECIRLRRTRTAGGIATKEFLFARGIGKIKETGDNQLEELVSCGAQ